MEETEDPLVTEAKELICRCISSGKPEKWLADHIEALIDAKLAVFLEELERRVRAATAIQPLKGE